MRASRAYIAGMGTAGVLVASLVLLLFVVGAVVAFNGSSVSEGIRQLEGLVVDRDEPVGLSGPALAAAEAAPTAGGVSPRPPATVVRSRPPGGTARPAPSSSSVAAADAPSGAGGAIPGGPPDTPPLDTPGSTGGGSEPPQLAPDAPADTGSLLSTDPDRPGQSLGQTTQELTDGVGSVVDGVDPRLGETVKGLGEGVGQLVDGLP